ncbi:MAG: HAMP domain-containing histidine kinase [Acetatifactor muris]|nr:HAMP domain-containing histidine kinase [Acetatifactor muris]
MKHQKKYRVRLRIYLAIVSIAILCAACLLSCGLVILGTVFLYHGELTLPIVVSLCLLVCTLTMVIGGIALYYGAAYFIKPIEEVNGAVNQIAKGDFEIRVSRSQQNSKDAVYVHELDELKANVNRMGAELAGMDYLRKDFVSNVSHEIKTPISAMMGFAEILLEDDALSGEQREYLTLIYDETARLSRLCENMLSMSRLENQALVTRHESVAVDEQIRKCVILLSEKQEGQAQEFELDLPPMPVNSDPDLLQQIWLNLIDNAMKYSEPGTVIHISGQNDTYGITVSVRDEGIGIPVEKQSHIFEAFYQCEESHKKDGNGLGLSIVKRITELLNGSIECRSIEGSGTQMTVKIQK